MAKEFDPVIICAALTGAATMKNNNPSALYTIEEFAEKHINAIRPALRWFTFMPAWTMAIPLSFVNH
jgi:hypothetical protein